MRLQVEKSEQSLASLVFFLEIMKKRKRNVSRKPNIATISEWRSQEEKEHDPEGDTFVIVSFQSNYTHSGLWCCISPTNHYDYVYYN